MRAHLAVTDGGRGREVDRSLGYRPDIETDGLGLAAAVVVVALVLGRPVDHAMIVVVIYPVENWLGGLPKNPRLLLFVFSATYQFPPPRSRSLYEMTQA